MLPFQSQAPNLSFSVFTTFQPIVLLGFSFFEGVALAGAGVFINLPTLALNVTQASNADTNCNPAAAGAAAGNYTRIEPEVQIVGGFIAEAEVGTDIRKLSEQTTYNVYSKNSTVPTQCLQFDQGNSSYEPAGAKTTPTSRAMGAPMVSIMILNLLGLAFGILFLL